VVKRLLDEGARVLGKTNLPPFAMDFQCANKLFGTSNNPWNRQYTTGGSSGGGAAAVAAGLSFLDIGTDLSGSLRIPASICGVFSLLPTEGLLSNEGMMADGAAPLDHFARIGPIAKTAEDLYLAWRVMSNQELKGGISKSKVENPKAINISWSNDCEGVPVCQMITKCFEGAVAKWAQNGVGVSRGNPKDFSFKHARRTFGEIMGYETGELLNPVQRILARLFGRSSARRSPEFIANVMLGYRHDKARYSAALEEKCRMEALVDGFLSDQVWVIPVTAASVFKHVKPSSDYKGVRDYKDPLMVNGHPVNYFDALTAFVTPISLTGHPVVTIPLGLDGNGLPVGAQIIGKKGSESSLIQTAKILVDILSPPDCPMLDEDHANA